MEKGFGLGIQEVHGEMGRAIEIPPHMVKPMERTETSEDLTDVCNQPPN